MPKFIDYHAQLPSMPPEQVQQMAQRIQAGQSDDFGVKPLNVFMGSNEAAFCLSEAPSADAVVESHQALGIPQTNENITQVQSVV